MKYSLVEVAPVQPGLGKREALSAALRAAEEAEAFEYHRIWYAEHHHSTGYASQDPVPLMAIAAQRTSRIRVGSGAVLLNYHSPFAVAERFLQLEALTPGRIDLGIGHASSAPLINYALLRDRNSQPTDDYSSQVKEVAGYYFNAFEDYHPFSTIDLTSGIDGVPELWLLGSSDRSARLAAALGLRYTYGGHIAPQASSTVLSRYQAEFVATPFGPPAPQTMLTLNIVAADDDELAHKLTFPARALRSFGHERPIPTLAQAERELSDDDKHRPSTIQNGLIPAQISGTVESLREQLQPLIRSTGATEIMVHDMVTDLELRSRSRQLVAQALAGIQI
ncbi:MsnO8 family LLM class oxidoreductase [Rhodococcus sp. KBS0724]|uniref:MsnO8 family LLM class oxidoreductase n=1 Tax=Rhodococcus sp. KBS0724 TaxID=1179674 RepID=UPI00110E3EE0|nr:MsnO8 family LLM class oxidoreductase [Rhodococcus sp. KBS0724]TSD40554.1 MsnO8 family LLM class oxidoreductase [Rhodococcus sp. KBS0724]